MTLLWRFLTPISILFTVCIYTVSSNVAAQDGQGISADNFKPSTSVHSLFETTLPRLKDHLDWSAGVLLHYAHSPVRRARVLLSSGNNNPSEEAYPLKLRLTADAYVALGLWNVLEVGLGIPVVAFQSGEGTEPGGNAKPAGLGDPRIEVKALLLNAGAFKGGAGLIVTVPLGHYASLGTDFMGVTAPTIEPRLLGSMELGPILLALNAGFLIRPHANMGNYEQNNAITWNVGAAWDISDFDEPGGLRLALETNGAAGINFSTLVETPMEVLAGAKYRFENDMIMSVGGGPGISTAVGTPAFRVFLGLMYDDVLRNCEAGPEDIDNFEDFDKCIDPDNDQDGLLDVEDDCPNEPEDEDGFKDDDGCPDLDNDSDGIPDVIDICPMLAEDADDFEDDDGCPEEGPGKPTVKITDTQLLLSSKVYFDFNKATIKQVSYPILDAVAEALNKNSFIKGIKVEGHTDNEGTEEYNLNLSKDRAKAVVEYLINKSVDAGRLTYEGHGFNKPKASNATQEGRAINRRVEFTITDKD